MRRNDPSQEGRTCGRTREKLRSHRSEERQWRSARRRRRGASASKAGRQERLADSVYIGKSVKPEFIWLRLANRHGLITGATGTGKTVTLQGLAEGFSDQGVPVFCADVKGDLSGIAEKGGAKGSIEAGAKEIGYPVEYRAFTR